MFFAKNKKGKIAQSSPPTAGGAMEQEVGFLKMITTAIVVVLFIGFAGMFVATAALLIQALFLKATSYEELQKEVMYLGGNVRDLEATLREENAKINKRIDGFIQQKRISQPSQ